MKPIRIKRFVNYKNLCIFISQLAHDYSRLGFDNFMSKHYNCKGIYARYLSGYRDYLTAKKNGYYSSKPVYTDKFILEPYLYEEYFKFKNKSILDNVDIVPELYNYGFIFTSVQEAVQSFVIEGEHGKGF